MKNNYFAALAAATITATALLSNQATAQDRYDPSDPTGTLNISSTLVKLNTKPTLTWDITQPPKLNFTIDQYMDVRVLGAQIGNGTDWYKVQAYVSCNGTSNYDVNPFFNGKETSIDKTKIYSTKLVKANTQFWFKARVATNNSNNPNSWQPYYQTVAMSDTTATNVKILKNGDVPPSYVPAFSNQSTIKSTVSSVFKDGKVNIGPKDLIVIFELWGTDKKASYFDMQDLVLLLTFRDVETQVK